MYAFAETSMATPPGGLMPRSRARCGTGTVKLSTHCPLPGSQTSPIGQLTVAQRSLHCPSVGSQVCPDGQVLVVSAEHWPVAGLHVPATWQRSEGWQTTPAQ